MTTAEIEMATITRATNTMSITIRDEGNPYLTQVPDILIRFYPNGICFENRKREKSIVYSVLNERPHEQLLVTLGLLILKPEPIRLST